MCAGWRSQTRLHAGEQEVQWLFKLAGSRIGQQTHCTICSLTCSRRNPRAQSSSRWTANLSPAQPSQLNALSEQPRPRLLCRSTLHCNEASPQPRSFAAEPNKALKHVSTLHMEGHGWLPKYVGSLPLQQLPCGSFSAKDLTWHHITERSTSSLVTAIPKARLDDFVIGEKVRGNSTVNM
jgi:hypothetical protein